MVSLLILPILMQITQSPTNVFKGLNQWGFGTLGMTLIYTTENLPTIDTKTWMTYSSLTAWINTINNKLKEIISLELTKKTIKWKNREYGLEFSSEKSMSHKNISRD